MTMPSAAYLAPVPMPGAAFGAPQGRGARAPAHRGGACQSASSECGAQQIHHGRAPAPQPAQRALVFKSTDYYIVYTRALRCTHADEVPLGEDVAHRQLILCSASPLYTARQVHCAQLQGCLLFAVQVHSPLFASNLRWRCCTNDPTVCQNPQTPHTPQPRAPPPRPQPLHCSDCACCAQQPAC